MHIECQKFIFPLMHFVKFTLHEGEIEQEIVLRCEDAAAVLYILNTPHCSQLQSEVLRILQMHFIEISSISSQALAPC